MRGLSDEDAEKIKAKKLRKIVIVMTDGKSDNAARVGLALKELRDKGIIVIGIGITRGAQAIRKTYAPGALVCEQANQLAVVLSNLLAGYLQELRGKIA